MRHRVAIVLTTLCLIGVGASGCAHLFGRPAVRFETASTVTIPYRDDWEGFHRRPIIEATINGVRGKFLIDTGADGPLLTMTAIRRCGIPLSKASISAGFFADEAPGRFPRVEGKVTIDLGQVTITWGNAAVAAGLGSEKWFGLMDYATLKAAHAVINVQERTITFSK